MSTDGSAVPTAAAALRPLLFGDLPAEAWPSDDAPRGEPWDGFVRARRHLADGDQDLAVREWSTIASFTGDEPRHILQAWHLLRSVNVHPDASIAADPLGVVVEVSVPGGHDLLAAYADGSSRYLHHDGGATVVDGPTPELAAPAVVVIDAAAPLAAATAPRAEPGLPELPDGHDRVVVLTRAGARARQGPSGVLQADEPVGEVFGAATALLVAVVGR